MKVSQKVNTEAGLIPVHTAAARAFTGVALKLIDVIDGHEATQERVASIVGEAPSNFSAAIAGTRGGSLDRVNRWMESWEKAGYPGMSLLVTRGGTEVSVETTLCNERGPNDWCCMLKEGHSGDHLTWTTVQIVPGRLVDVLRESKRTWERTADPVARA